MIDQNNNERTKELNLALEALHFGFRALIAKPDERLAEIAYSRVHHRILYFIARYPQCSINELLNVMGVSKQYLNRPLRKLTEDDYVIVNVDTEDKRVKRVSLSQKGALLETELSGDQRERFEKVFEQAGPDAEAGWRKVMALLVDSAQD
ncbi:MAG: MarR family transcriptional regulator [endosymbiont of Galathealinum brachiosum]|uniref:MarR family transcriptional regulator n=1 Tax=endosymbiont of Galathealinum brachiosum TaxID=2200906 RepID=A0A370DI87_9GAMM|nr:MAG: MarR family transcriptional regulator [endosymbiont of Galathealinum brachiosum]